MVMMLDHVRLLPGALVACSSARCGDSDSCSDGWSEVGEACRVAYDVDMEQLVAVGDADGDGWDELMTATRSTPTYVICRWSSSTRIVRLPRVISCAAWS